MTSIKLLHVLALECHPQGVSNNEGMKVQHTDPGTVHPHWYH